MKYLGAGPFSVSVGGGDRYDATFGKKCFYCRKAIDENEAEDWEANAHKACDPDRSTSPAPTDPESR